MTTCAEPSYAYSAAAHIDAEIEAYERWAKNTRCAEAGCGKFFTDEKLGCGFCTWLEQFAAPTATPWSMDCTFWEEA